MIDAVHVRRSTLAVPASLLIALAPIVLGGADRVVRRPIRVEAFLRDLRDPAILAHPDEIKATGEPLYIQCECSSFATTRSIVLFTPKAFPQRRHE